MAHSGPWNPKPTAATKVEGLKATVPAEPYTAAERGTHINGLSQ